MDPWYLSSIPLGGRNPRGASKPNQNGRGCPWKRESPGPRIRVSEHVSPPSGCSGNCLTLPVKQLQMLFVSSTVYLQLSLHCEVTAPRGQPHSSCRPAVTVRSELSRGLSINHETSLCPETWHFLASTSVLILSCFLLLWEKPTPSFSLSVASSVALGFRSELEDGVRGPRSPGPPSCLPQISTRHLDQLPNLLSATLTPALLRLKGEQQEWKKASSEAAPRCVV